MIALTRSILFCAVVLAYPRISAAQSPPNAQVLFHANEWLKDSGGKPCGAGEGGCVNIGGDPSDPNGVPVCSNSGGTCDTQGAIGTPFQCVELAQRLYSRKGWYKPYGTLFPVSSAYQIFDIAQRQLGFETLAQGGSITHVMPGDMIVHASNDPGTDSDGHVSIIDTVTNIANVLTVNVKEQNRSSNGTANYIWSNGSLSRDNALIQGVVHSPLNSPLTVRRSDLSEWCVRGGADEARLLPGHNDAYSWACYKRGAPSQPGINMLTYCQQRHPNLNYVDFMLDFKNPSSWQCYGPVTKLGALLDVDPTGHGRDLTTYCRNNNSALKSSVTSTTVDNHWYCSSVAIRTDYFGDFSMTQACRELYSSPSAYARIANYYDPNSVECWGPKTAQSVPTAPSNVMLDATVSGGAGIGVSWKDHSNNEAGFDVFSRNTGMHIRVQPGQTFIASDWGG